MFKPVNKEGIMGLERHHPAVLDEVTDIIDDPQCLLREDIQPDTKCLLMEVCDAT